MFSAHYSWMIYCLSDEFFDAMLEEDVRSGTWWQGAEAQDTELLYCAGGPI